jgi:hypothetical protein
MAAPWLGSQDDDVAVRRVVSETRASRKPSFRQIE